MLCYIVSSHALCHSFFLSLSLLPSLFISVSVPLSPSLSFMSCRVACVKPLMKYLWRANILECPAFCDFSVKWAECQCALNADMVAGKTPAEV